LPYACDDVTPFKNQENSLQTKSFSVVSSPATFGKEIKRKKKEKEKEEEKTFLRG
jgi:hypothetical protein